MAEHRCIICNAEAASTWTLMRRATKRSAHLCIEHAAPFAQVWNKVDAMQNDGIPRITPEREQPPMRPLDWMPLDK